MNPVLSSEENRQEQLQKKVKEDVQREYNSVFSWLREKDGFCEEYEYFFKVLSYPLYPRKFRNRINKPLAGLSCIQVPLEIFDALGIHPFRLCSGTLAAHRLSSPHVPALTCPIIKSCLGCFYLEESLEKLCDLIIIPTTCDWAVKLPEMIGNRVNSIYLMELPHVKESERGRRRWMQEIYELKKILENLAGCRLNRRRLRSSIRKYVDAWRVLGQLIQLKRKKMISGTLSLVVTNAFSLDTIESWTKSVEKILIKDHPPVKKSIDIFLAGSPLFFPYLKLAKLIEQAGMFIAGDELCTSERIMTNVPVYDDPSEYGLIKALAEQYHLSCSCPVYTDNDRRIKNILETLRIHGIKGVVYHVLKGCHPYDIESFYFEEMIKKSGFRFIKIETDYSGEDQQTILTRLEAFRETLV